MTRMPANSESPSPARSTSQRESLKFDAIVLDISMKRMNGDEVCRRLRAHGIVLPIIAATGVTKTVRVRVSLPGHHLKVARIGVALELSSSS